MTHTARKITFAEYYDGCASEILVWIQKRKYFHIKR